IYRKRNVRTPEPRLPVFPLTRSHLAGERPQVERRDWPEDHGALHHRMVERYAPPSLLVSPEDKVLHLSEHAGRYLVHPGGVPTASVFKLVRDELRLELRSLLHAARGSGEAATSRPLVVAHDDGQREVVLHVRPTDEAQQEGFALVIFDERERPSGAASQEAEPEAAANGLRLEKDLDLTRQRLRAVIEEHESSQEEMRASNEELQSTNEELRSTMEELETSKEELQSMNEELQTVNQENRHKVEELSQLSSDLQNLLAATDIATLFLDRELRILRFTPKVGELFNVRMADRGRPISDLTHRLGYGELREDARRVLADLVPIERKVNDEEGRWYLARIMPYRSTDDRIEGVVLTFVDVTRLQRAEDALRELNESLEQRVEKRTREVRRLSSRLTRAEQIERRRIARILHDDLQQQLHGVQMKLAIVRSGLEAGDPGAVVDTLGEAETLLARSTAITRRLSIDLSPPVLDGDSLVEPLRWLGEQMKQRHDLDVELAIDGEPAIPREEDRVLLFEAVRELLFNVVKHAGTRQARIELDGNGDDGVCIVVSDDGAGFEPEALATGDQTGMGFASLHQRLELAGGSVDLESSPGSGSTVILRLSPRPAAEEGGSR
ncbi:MAG TPA: PAS domain-containing protein, partial [Thermoanaerobaculia bacterium]|nr:PAS domain-containing protein [Thermoanaerobaculia bacterium]